MPQAAPYTVASLAAYARSQEAGLENEPDWKLAHYVFQTQPELQQDTKLQSSQEIARTAFENAQPRGPMYFAATEGDRLKDFFTSGLADFAERNRAAAQGYEGPSISDRLKGMASGLESAAYAPIAAYKAKTPEDIQSGLHDVLTQTLPLVAGVGSVVKTGIAGAGSGLKPYIPSSEVVKGGLRGGAKLGATQAASLAAVKAGRLVGMGPEAGAAAEYVLSPYTKDAVGELKGVFDKYKHEVAINKMSDIKPNTTPPAGATPQATPTRVPPPYTPSQDPFEARSDVPAVEQVPHSTPQTTTQTTTRSSGPIESASPVNGPALPKTNNPIGRSSGSTSAVGPIQDPNKFSFKFQDLPRFKADLPEAPPTQPSGTFKAVSNGIPTERINQLGGPSKLIDMANNVDAIKATKGFDVMSEKIDPLVGGAFGRARLMASTEFGSQAQNVISELVKAYKQGNLPEILRRKDQLQILARQARSITLPPPPPG